MLVEAVGQVAIRPRNRVRGRHRRPACRLRQGQGERSRRRPKPPHASPGGNRRRAEPSTASSRRRRALSGQPGERDAQDQRARQARAGESRRSRAGRSVARRTRKRATWPLPPKRASISTNRPRPRYQTVTGATVSGDKTKAEADVQAAQQASTPRRKSTTAASICRNEGALAQKPGR